MEQESLFRREVDLPLAARMRPKRLADYVGQQHLVGKGKMLRKLIAEDKIFSMIFWGRRASARRPWHASSQERRRRGSSTFPP